MKGEWCYFKSYFSPEYCDKLVNQAKKLEFKDITNWMDKGIKKVFNIKLRIGFRLYNLETSPLLRQQVTGRQTVTFTEI